MREQGSWTESWLQGEGIKLSKILIFAGTTEGRQLSEYLCERKVEHTVCVATEYGEIVLRENSYARIHKGRMDSAAMAGFFAEQACEIVVDATHPYATVVTENIRAAVNVCKTPIEYLRLKRETEIGTDYDTITYFPDHTACAAELDHIEGNILLTTGSKELSAYCARETVKERLYVRVLPGIESIRLCMEQGIAGRHILALQGPFGIALNEALIEQYEIKCLVTKKSGAAGGWREKIAAAKNKNIPVYVVGQSGEEEGLSFAEVCEYLERRIGEPHSKKLQIVLAGIGMGETACMTKAVASAIEEADILLGARRMIEPYPAKIEKKPYYMAEQILPYLQKVTDMDPSHEKIKVVILFSGDAGFYSGCKKLYAAIDAEIASGRIQADVSVLPGISSVAYLAAAVGESYSDAYIASLHGVTLSNLASRISRHEKTFLLMSGVSDVHTLGRLLSEDDRYGLAESTVYVGYQLSYPEEKIRRLSPQECMQLTDEGLYICMVRNEQPLSRAVTPHLRDAVFLREKVPMTKEEIRQISVCKLHLKADSVLYDVGSGTGSIAMEAALLSEDMEVYAIEQKEAAVHLIERNKERFALDNVHIVRTTAPEGLQALPMPTHAFIGGSGGRLKEIVDCLRAKNPNIRIVINAISMETICEIREILTHDAITDADIVQLQVSRSKQLGSYHLMQAENPIWICAFDMKG